MVLDEVVGAEAGVHAGIHFTLGQQFDAAHCRGDRNLGDLGMVSGEPVGKWIADRNGQALVLEFIDALDGRPGARSDHHERTDEVRPGVLLGHQSQVTDAQGGDDIGLFVLELGEHAGNAVVADDFKFKARALLDYFQQVRAQALEPVVVIEKCQRCIRPGYQHPDLAMGCEPGGLGRIQVQWRLFDDEVVAQPPARGDAHHVGGRDRIEGVVDRRQ
ncbi:hypothetical protein D3C78_1056740 [compost metagenome]